MIYHVSKSNLNGKIFKPRIPDNFFTRNGFEENKTPRVSFAQTIDGAIMGISQNVEDMILYVHVPKDDNIKYIPAKNVPDKDITGEVWVTQPVELKCIGSIKVTEPYENGISFKYGKYTAELYKWKWKWINRKHLTESVEYYLKEEIDMSSYSQEFAYHNFLLEEVKRQADIDRYINECILMNESKNTVANISVLNEGFMDTLKNVVNKLTGILTTMWNKFIEATNNLLKTDKGYLERYKDIILKKKPLQYKVQMYDYPKGIPLILSRSAPYFNFNEMVKEGKAKDKETFISSYFNSFAGSENRDLSFEDIAKSKFRGGDKQLEIPSDQLNFTDMYNYCYTYDNLRKKIEKDKSTIINAGNTAINAVNSMVNSGQIKEGNNPPAENNNNQNGDNNQAKQESFIFTMGNKRLYYSHVLESFVLEADDDNSNQTRTADNSSDAGSTMKKSQNPSAAYRIVSPSDEEKNKATIAKAEEINGSSLTSKQVTDMIKVYMDVCGALFAAKLTASENAYRTYMKIIKAHVKDYVKVPDNANDNRAAQTGTTYASNNNNNNGNEQNNNNNGNEQNNNNNK